MKSVAVFCGSNTGTDPAFAQAAAATGRLIAARGLLLVYGGGHRGLMGVTADAALAAGGQVHGVITEYLKSRELQHTRIQRCDVVADMAERKHRFADLADAFVVLGGGIGTLEEMSDMWSRAQLGDLRKPIGIVNTRGFYDPLLAMFDRMVADAFLPAGQKDWLVVGAEPATVLDGLARFSPAQAVSKWI
ncbi:MAG: TIGR00730 family Rossman fold protein [Burkholderiales bacterium]|nr:TIGR00730 family Rossman fold protein [Burkholderiales bacterium]